MDKGMLLFLFTGLQADTLFVKARNLDRAVELVLANLPEYEHQGKRWVSKRIKELDQDEGVIFVTRSVWS